MDYTKGMLRKYRSLKKDYPEAEDRMIIRRNIYEDHIRKAAADIHREREGEIFAVRTPDLNINEYIRMIHMFEELYSK